LTEDLWVGEKTSEPTTYYPHKVLRPKHMKYLVAYTLLKETKRRLRMNQLKMTLLNSSLRVSSVRWLKTLDGILNLNKNLGTPSKEQL